MKIGVLGGSFNPIHIGHLLAGHVAAEALALERVLITPCALSPFKQGAADLATPEARLAMIRLSIENDPLFEVSLVDLERGGVSYALDTINAVRVQYATAQLYFIVGADALQELSRWHRVRELLQNCEIITIERPGMKVPLQVTELEFPAAIRQRLAANIIRGHGVEISSSGIRRRIAQGRSIRYLVTPAVEEYLRIRRLYVGQTCPAGHQP